MNESTQNYNISTIYELIFNFERVFFSLLILANLLILYYVIFEIGFI